MELINAAFVRNHQHLPLFPMREDIIKWFGNQNAVFRKKYLQKCRQEWANGHAGGCEWNPNGTAICPGGSRLLDEGLRNRLDEMRRESSRHRDEMSAHKTKYERLESKYEELCTRLRESTQDLHKMTEMNDKDATNTALKKGLEDMTRAMSELNKTIQSMEEREGEILEDNEAALEIVEKERDNLRIETQGWNEDLDKSKKEKNELMERAKRLLKDKDTALSQLNEEKKADMDLKEKECAQLKVDLEDMSSNFHGMKQDNEELEKGNRFMMNCMSKFINDGRSLYREAEDHLEEAGRRQGRRGDQRDMSWSSRVSLGQPDLANATGEMTPMNPLRKRKGVKKISNSKRMKESSVLIPSSYSSLNLTMSDIKMDDEALLMTPGECLTK